MKKIIILGSVFICSIALYGCGNDKEVSKLERENESLKSQNTKLLNRLENKNDTQKSSETKESSSKNNKDSYGLNEEVFISKASTGERVYSIKLIKATTALDSNSSSDLYTDGKPENTVQLTYEYTNYKMSTPMMISAQFLNAYDSTGLAGKAKGLIDGQTNVSEGKTSTTITWFVMNEKMTDKDKVEIEYANDFSLGFEGSKKFAVPLEH